MFIDSRVLIDETIDRLQMLSEFFADESGERLHQRPGPTAAARACRDAHDAIASLIPKLKAARVTQEPIGASRVCVNCDDF